MVKKILSLVLVFGLVLGSFTGSYGASHRDFTFGQVKDVEGKQVLFEDILLASELAPRGVLGDERGYVTVIEALSVLCSVKGFNLGDSDALKQGMSPSGDVGRISTVNEYSGSNLVESVVGSRVGKHIKEPVVALAYACGLLTDIEVKEFKGSKGEKKLQSCISGEEFGKYLVRMTLNVNKLGKIEYDKAVFSSLNQAILVDMGMFKSAKAYKVFEQKKGFKVEDFSRYLVWFLASDGIEYTATSYLIPYYQVGEKFLTKKLELRDKKVDSTKFARVPMWVYMEDSYRELLLKDLESRVTKEERRLGISTANYTLNYSLKFLKGNLIDDSKDLPLANKALFNVDSKGRLSLGVYLGNKGKDGSWVPNWVYSYAERGSVIDVDFINNQQGDYRDIDIVEAYENQMTKEELIKEVQRQEKEKHSKS